MSNAPWPYDSSPDRGIADSAGDSSADPRACAGGLFVGVCRDLRDEAAGHADRCRETTAERVDRVSDALRQAADHLSPRQRTLRLALLAAGDRTDEVANWIRSVDGRQAAESIRTLATTRPVIFSGGALLLGLALGRFARSTAGPGSSTAGGRAMTSSSRAR